MLAIVLHPASGAAAPARRTVHGMNPGLRGDDLPLDASQHQPRIGQGQIQIGDVVEAIGPADLHDVRTPLLAFGADFHQPQNPSHAPTLGQRTDADIPDRRRTPNLATVPMNAWGLWANVQFVESATSPQVRIGRTAGDGFWSYLGTDILQIAASERTMNLD